MMILYILFIFLIPTIPVKSNGHGGQRLVHTCVRSLVEVRINEADMISLF